MKIFNNPFYNKLVSLLWATWFGHAVLRVLHFSRLDAFGNPIVEKVEWYIFHAFCIDLIWIAISFSPILLYGLFSKPSEKVQKVLLMVYGGLHLILLNITVIDHEFYRFMGGHFSPNMAQTYTNTSSIRELFSMLNGDKSIPYFSFAVFLIGSIAFLYANYWINSRRSESTKKRTLILAIWVLVAYLYTGVFWKGGHRENRLAPIYKIALKAYLESTIEVEPKDIAIWTKEYQSRWNSHYKSQPDYKFNNEEYPFYKIPVEKKCDSLNCVEEVEKPMNVVLIFLESHRGLHQGYLKKYGAESDGTPYLNELAKSSLVFSDAHASGLPTIGAFMATQLSLIDHPLAFLATGFTSTNFISLPDILKAKGYNTSFYTSPDPSWDGQTFWLSKWYDEYHYSRNRK
jgi:hypothetical protein